jgi:excisionase family DNA binding protein
MQADQIVATDLGEGQRRKLAVSVAEAAFETGVGRDKLYAAIRDGRLEAKKFGRRTLITIDALRRFLDGLPPLQLPSV